jgi:hypothetical protein
LARFTASIRKCDATAIRKGVQDILAIVSDLRLSRKVEVDVGRVHCNRWLFAGGSGPDIARVYGDVPVRSTLEAENEFLRLMLP